MAYYKYIYTLCKCIVLHARLKATGKGTTLKMWSERVVSITKDVLFAVSAREREERGRTNN
jgi:hypothetical protein